MFNSIIECLKYVRMVTVRNKLNKQTSRIIVLQEKSFKYETLTRAC